jgi:hypothetical protein
MLKRAAVTAALLALSLGARAEPPSCADSPKRVGACFTVHGRLTGCAGSPTFRIWRIGTQRILGVEDPTGDPVGEPLLPEPLQTTMLDAGPCGTAAFGDFTVCPLEPDAPGVMRRVCVVSATKLVFRDQW